MWQIIDFFKKEDSLSKVTYQELQRGLTKNQNKKRRLSHEMRMKEYVSLAKNYGTMSPIEYLRAIVRHF